MKTSLRPAKHHITRKIGQLVFSLERLPFFSEIFAFNNLLGVTEMML